MYSLYSLLLFLALIVSTPWWLLQMLRHGKYRTGWGERLGSVPQRLLREASEPTIWIHAVSVGEVLAISRVVEELKAQLTGWRVVVSTATDTGQKLARQRFAESDVFYLPLDLPFAVRPFSQALRPKLLVLAESEFWPNLLHWARLSGAAVAVVNARVSDRSLPGYLRFTKLLQPVMRDVDLFLAQSDEDARRLVQIGAPAERVHVSGNLKFEVKLPAKSDIVGQFSDAIQREDIGPVIVAGSTLDGEETMLLEMFRSVGTEYPGALLVLAPRHPERFSVVADLLTSSGIRYQRRSQWDGRKPIAGGVLLLDTIGELAGLYEFAEVTFIGGSLVPRGGHNVLEAAQFGKAILVGPHTENFRDIIDIFRRADALRVVTPQSLTPTVLQLLENHDERAALGQRAFEVMRSQQGATDKTVNALLRLLSDHVPAAAVSSEKASVNPLSSLYGAIVKARNGLYDHGALRIRTLQGPAVSIGNLNVGGSGKTPFLIAMGELLKERGIAFDVLSRGYGRTTKGVALVDPEGSPRDFGDEPLLIARKLRVPVIVGEDRYAAGQFAEQKFGPQLHLLDDGFQHRRLARDFDIVLIAPSDAEDSLLPTGRLREPLLSLSRADAVVLTNDASSQGLSMTQQLVWKVRRGVVVPAELKDPCFAFCGIARPENFFEQLRAAGVALAGTRSFRDHHAYTDSDVRQLLALRAQYGAAALVTTEKDAVNLESRVAALASLYVIAVHMELNDAEAALSALLEAIAARNHRPA